MNSEVSNFDEEDEFLEEDDPFTSWEKRMEEELMERSDAHFDRMFGSDVDEDDDEFEDKIDFDL